MYDERLVRAAQEGDEAAFAALYDRAVDSVYDLAWSLTGDADESARLVETAFVLAARNLDQLTDPSQVRPWLLAIVGDLALADEQDGVLRSGWENHGPTATDDEPLGQVALRRWVSDAAAVLALPDQLVLELQLRHDLDPDQLAAAVGCTPEQLPSVLDRVDAEARTVLSALILARQGRRNCAGLAAALEGWDGSASVETAEAADAHAQTCTRCARRRKAINPLDLIAEAPLIAAPAALRNPILEQVAGELRGTGGAGTGTVAVAALPRREARAPSRETRMPVGALVGAGVVLVVLLAAVLIALNLGSGSKGSSAVTAGTTVTTTGAATPGVAPTLAPFDSTTSTSVVPGSVLSLNTSSVNLGTSATTAQLILSDTAATPATWSAGSVPSWLTVAPASGYLGSSQSVRVTIGVDRTAAPQGPFNVRVVFSGADQGSRAASVSIVGSNSPTTTTSPTTTAPQLTVTASASPTTVYTTPCTLRALQSTVTATVTDTVGTPTVELSYSMPDGSAGAQTMAQSGNQWTARLPASNVPGTITYVVRASDGSISRSAQGSVTVASCNPAQ